MGLTAPLIMLEGAALKIISANALKEGHPLWWTGAAWSRDIEMAVHLEPAKAQAVLDARLKADATLIASGELEDALNRRGETLRRQAIRAVGPTVRPDLHRVPEPEPMAFKKAA
jgi:Protein of unknown function (DUF2849)